MEMEGCSEIVLFGARIVVDSMRKTASLNNLSDYQHVSDAANPTVKAAGGGGYLSDNVARVAAVRERKRGTPWSEEEHKLFLTGLKKVGKGDWRGISKNFVKTRTPTQVASHAQKYFLRHTTVKSRRRSSLFDITTEMVNCQKMIEENLESANGDSVLSHPQLPSTGPSKVCVPMMVPTLPSQMTPVILAAYPLSSSIPSQVTQQQMKIHPPAPIALQLFTSPNPNSVTNYSSLSLNLGLSLPSLTQASPNPALNTTTGLMSKDGYISVA